MEWRPGSMRCRSSPGRPPRYMPALWAAQDVPDGRCKSSFTGRADRARRAVIQNNHSVTPGVRTDTRGSLHVRHPGPTSAGRVPEDRVEWVRDTHGGTVIART